MTPSDPKNSKPRPSGVTKREYEALADFRYALRQFLHFSEKAAHEAGISPQQHQALLAVVGFPGRDRITVGELAERLQIAHHSAVGLVDRLCLRKLIVRECGIGDARQVFLSVTRDGYQLLESLTATHKEEIKRLGPQVNALLKYLHGYGAGDRD